MTRAGSWSLCSSVALVAIGALRESHKMITCGTKDTALASTNDWASIVGNKFKIQQQEQLSLLRDNKIGRGRAKAWLDTGVRDAAKMAGRPLLSAQETVSRSAGGDVPGAEAMAQAIATVTLRRSGSTGATPASFMSPPPGNRTRGRGGTPTAPRTALPKAPRAARRVFASAGVQTDLSGSSAGSFVTASSGELVLAATSKARRKKITMSALMHDNDKTAMDFQHEVKELRVELARKTKTHSQLKKRSEERNAELLAERRLIRKMRRKYGVVDKAREVLHAAGMADYVIGLVEIVADGRLHTKEWASSAIAQLVRTGWRKGSARKGNRYDATMMLGAQSMEAERFTGALVDRLNAAGLVPSKKGAEKTREEAPAHGVRAGWHEGSRRDLALPAARAGKRNGRWWWGGPRPR